MDILFFVLTGLFGLMILFVLFLLFFQFLFVFVPRKEVAFQGDGKIRRIAIIIPAHNEAAVIGETLTRLQNGLDYPKDKYDIFVCADNCSDDTFAIASSFDGVKVYERHENDPAKRIAAYPIRLLCEKVLEEGGYEAIIKFDADNIPSPNFLMEMNNALGDGVTICRAHEAPSNLGQNALTATSAIYYSRDSRLASNFRERAGMNSMISGAGMMVATSVLQEIGGWDALSNSDDAEFAVKRMKEGRRIHYASQAIVYEDQAATKKDTDNRNARMGNGLTKIYYREGPGLLKMFFKTGKITYLDMWAQLSFVPLPLYLGIGIPVYAVFFYVTLALQAAGIPVYPEYLFSLGEGGTAYWTIWISLIGIGGALLLFYVLWTYQSWLALYLDRKILGKGWFKKAWVGIFFGAFVLLFWSLSISKGAAKKNVSWQAIKRNKK